MTAGGNWLTGTIPGEPTGAWATDNTGALYFDIVLAGKDSAPVPAGSLNSWLTISSSTHAQTANSTNLMVTTNNQIGITNFILLPGIRLPSSANSMKIMRPPGQELLECRRYYQKLGGVTAADIGLQGYHAAGNTFATTLPFGIIMRSSPAVSEFGSWF